MSPFPGSYSVLGTVAETPGTGTAVVNGWQATIQLSYGPASFTLLVEMPSGSSNNCEIAANVTGSGTFTLQPGTCAPWVDSYGCTETWTYSGGSGTRSGNTLNVSAAGTYSQADCPNGLDGVNGALTIQFSGTD